MFIFSMLIFLAVTLGLVSLFLWVTPSQTDRRLQALTGAAEKSPWTETIVKIVGPFAQLSSPTDEANASPLRLKFLNAGIRHADAQLIYFGAKTLLPLLFAALAFTAPAYAAPTGKGWIHRKRQQRMPFGWRRLKPFELRLPQNQHFKIA